jgi:hypothetical protein
LRILGLTVATNIHEEKTVKAIALLAAFCCLFLNGCTGRGTENNDRSQPGVIGSASPGNAQPGVGTGQSPSGMSTSSGSG